MSKLVIHIINRMNTFDTHKLLHKEKINIKVIFYIKSIMENKKVDNLN